MRRAALAAALALAALFALAPPAAAFVEETCFGRNNVTALFQASIDLNCKVDANDPQCTATNLASGSQTFGADTCRGFLHFDAIFFTAQAVGFTRDAAYWFAASSNTIDFVQWTPTDSCGTPLPVQWFPPKMRGMMRISTLTGSHIRHLGILYGLTRPPTNGLNPRVQDYNSEGMLAQARTWAFGRSDLLCTCGITYPKNGNYFKGDRCLDDGSFVDNTIRPPILGTIIQGPIPAAAANTTLGEQIIDYDCPNDPNCDYPNPATITNITKVRQLGAYMASLPTSKDNATGQTIPELWVRYGIYLHQLADRTSHYYCGDKRLTAMYKAGPKLFRVSWSPKECNFVNHGNEHAWEQMLEPGIPEQSWATLALYYKELLAFKNFIQSSKPSWFNPSYKPMTLAQLVGTRRAKGILVQMAEMKDVVARMDRFIAELKKAGYGQVPGQEKRCPAWRRTSYSV
ncbi:hypothetical protein DFJ74DRAFT_774883 [Hyaloraphidium curvatum]|nr:hypothetical protein DFJ74DRAFT_774883 [Hyaloraphidium curvatum]